MVLTFFADKRTWGCILSRLDNVLLSVTSVPLHRNAHEVVVVTIVLPVVVITVAIFPVAVETGGVVLIVVAVVTVVAMALQKRKSTGHGSSICTGKARWPSTTLSWGPRLPTLSTPCGLPCASRPCRQAGAN